MVAMQWQGGVLSLLDQGAYPQEEKWLTCNTWEETAQALATPAVQEEKVAAIAAAYGYAQAAIAAQDKLGTDAFQAALDQAKEQLLASRPGSRDVAAALAFVETPPEAYTKNADKLTAILATAVTFDRQQVVADRNLCRNGTDLMGEGTRILIRTDRGGFHSASPPGPWASPAGAGSGNCWSRSPSAKAAPPSPPGPCWPTSWPGRTSPAP